MSYQDTYEAWLNSPALSAQEKAELEEKVKELEEREKEVEALKERMSEEREVG